MHVTVIRTTPDQLTCREWVFQVRADLHGLSLILDRYYEAARPGRRYKFRRTRTYGPPLLDPPEAELYTTWTSDPAAAPIPPDVAEEATAKVRATPILVNYA